MTIEPAPGSYYHANHPGLHFHGGPLDGLAAHMQPEAWAGLDRLRVPGGWYVRDGLGDEWDWIPTPDPHRD